MPKIALAMVQAAVRVIDVSASMDAHETLVTEKRCTQMLRKLLAILGVFTLSIWAVPPAQASAIINVEQVGPDVVATITGSINREGLTFSYAYTYNQVGIIAGADNFDGLIGVGESTTVAIYYYVSEHHDFSNSPLYFHATSNTGGHFQIREVNYSDQASLMLPYNYVSNDPINSSSTWAGNTIASMGLISGTYIYNLGNGETITLNIAQGPAPTYSVGGTVSGLTASGLVLQNNGVDDLPVAADGPFTFATELEDAAPYAVTVSVQPTGQTCSVTDGGGVIAAADVTNVAVTCVDDVILPITPPVPVPATSQWALFMISILLGFIVLANRKRLF